MHDDLVRLRQEIHQDPEIGLDLPRTQEKVLRELDGLGLEISTGTATTSVTAVLRGGARDDDDPRTVLLRADMDALPVAEETGLDVRLDQRRHARLRPRPAHRQPGRRGAAAEPAPRPPRAATSC